LQEEKDGFQRLSVFRGGFSREAAQQVAGASLHTITSLLDKSLLKRVGDDRYDLHELVRQYAAARLESDLQELEQSRDRHSRYFAALLEGWQKQLRSPRQLDILGEMSADMDNVRLAWDWMVAHGQFADIRRSLHCLRHFYEIRGRYQEAEILFGQAVETIQSIDGAGAQPEMESRIVLGSLLTQHAYFNTTLGRYGRASALMQDSLTLLRSADDPAALADTLTLLAYLQYRQGKLRVAIQSALESLDLNRTLDNPFGIAYCLIILSYIHLAQGEYEQAYALSSESLGICRNLVGDPHGMADSLITLSAASIQLGKYNEARSWAEESLQISQISNDRWGIGQTLRELGLISLKLGETDRAEAILRQSLSQFKETGDSPLMARTLIDLGIVLRESGAYSESRQCLRDALQTAIETQSVDIALHAIVEISLMVMDEGMTEQAMELVAHSLQNPP
jgi:tetratricopeptide (TPR) repeat protein